MGLVDGGTRPAWKFAIEKWGVSRVTMVGTAIDADSKGKYETVTINGVPEMVGTGVMHTKARYKGGKHSTGKVTVTWYLPPFKLPGRGFQ